MFAIQQNDGNHDGNLDDSRQDPRACDISAFINLRLFKLINHQKKFDGQDQRNQRGADKVDHAGGDKFQAVTFDNVISNAAKRPNDNGIDKKLCGMKYESFAATLSTMIPDAHQNQRGTAAENYRQIKRIIYKQFSDHDSSNSSVVVKYLLIS